MKNNVYIEDKDFYVYGHDDMGITDIICKKCNKKMSSEQECKKHRKEKCTNEI